MGNDIKTDKSDQKSLPWYFKTPVIVIAFLSVGPLALPMVWFHPRYTLLKKVVVTVLAVVLTYYSVVAMSNSMKLLMQLYHDLTGN